MLNNEEAAIEPPLKPLTDEDIKRISVEAANDTYKIVYTSVYKYEPRGFNAHQRAQSISEQVKDKVKETLEQYRSHLPPEFRP